MLVLVESTVIIIRIIIGNLRVYLPFFCWLNDSVIAYQETIVLLVTYNMCRLQV